MIIERTEFTQTITKKRKFEKVRKCKKVMRERERERERERMNETSIQLLRILAYITMMLTELFIYNKINLTT